MEALEYVRENIDDLLVITRGSLEDHLEKLREVLRRLRDAGLKVNAAKSFFCVRRDPKVLRRESWILNKEGLHFANLFYIFE